MRFDPGNYRHQFISFALFLPFLWLTLKVFGPIDQFQDESKKRMYAALAVAVGAIGGANLLGRSHVQRRREELAHRIRQIVPEFEQPWLFSEAKLIEYEGTVNTKTVWVITPDLAKDGEPGESAFQDVVRHNLRRGVQYTYIYPDNELTRAREVGLRMLFRGHQKLLTRCVLPGEDFAKLAIAHMVIYNPEMDNARGSTTVFLEAPVGGPPHWVRIQDRKAAVKLIGRYARVLESYPRKRGVNA